MGRKAKNRIERNRKTFTRFLSVFKEEVVLKQTIANKEIAKALTNEAKQIIISQRYEWVPLSDKYLRRKIAEGHDKRTYVRTAEFLNSISWGVTPMGLIWAGIPPKKIHEDSGLPLHILARIHEFGTEIVPPRPIWRPLLSKYVRQKPDFAKRYRKSILQMLNRIKKR